MPLSSTQRFGDSAAVIIGDIDDYSVDDDAIIGSSLNRTATLASTQNTTSPRTRTPGPLANSANSSLIRPGTNADGMLVSEGEFRTRLETYAKKAPLLNTCNELKITVPKQANLARLRREILHHWYPSTSTQRPTRPLPKKPKKNVANPATSSKASPSLASPSLHTAATSATSSIVQTSTEAAASDTSSDVQTTARTSTKRASGHQDVELDGSLYMNDEELLREMAPPSIDFREEDDDDDDDENGKPKVLSYVVDGMDCDEDDEEADEDDFEASRKRMRVDADREWQNNRRVGGVRAQGTVMRSWNKFLALHAKELPDNIVDEHSLLKCIQWTFNRPKLDRRGNDIPGTFVSASAIKKMFFGVLRIRKTQEAADPALKLKRPALTNLVWDFVKTQMSLALKRVRDGLVPNEDMPDLVANTILDKLSDEQMNRLTVSFLEHSQLRVALSGHLAWTAQNASGKRGDDLRSIRIRELQPHQFLHPNKETVVESILGMQGEEKVAAQGMKAVSRPSLTTWILHRDPLWDAIGAIMRQQHWLHDVFGLESKMEIDWTVNRSWGHVRLLNGGQSPDKPYNYQNLYNVFCQAFLRAGFQSRIKQHLPRKVLGHRQERMGVTSTSTAKLGWYQQDTYHSVYAPQIPKDAVLAAHGYKEHENYDPLYHRVAVPEQFLSLVIPRAEEILQLVQQAQVKQNNLQGCANYWKMIIQYRPVFFQTSAAIHEVLPKSAIFRLPALSHPDVMNWMTSRFPSEYSALKAEAGSPVDLTRIQDKLVLQALEQNRASVNQMNIRQLALQEAFMRRTQQFSPTKFSSDLYHSRYQASATSSSSSLSSHALPPPKVTLAIPSLPTCEHVAMNDEVIATSSLVGSSPAATLRCSSPPSTPTRTIQFTPHHTPKSSPTPLFPFYSQNSASLPCTPSRSNVSPPTQAPHSGTSEATSVHEQIVNENAGVYHSPDRSIRAYADPLATRTKSTLDLALPPLQAFVAPGLPMSIGWPAIFGKKALAWNEVFDLIKQVDLLWEVWKPNKTLDKYSDVMSVWRCYNNGEVKIDQTTQQESGVKPPLRLIEQHFKAQWRKTTQARKSWQRFLAIPDYIDVELRKGRREKVIVEELESKRMNSSRKCGLNQLALMLEDERKSLPAPPVASSSTAVPLTETAPAPKKPRKPTVNRRPKPKRT